MQKRDPSSRKELDQTGSEEDTASILMMDTFGTNMSIVMFTKAIEDNHI